MSDGDTETDDKYDRPFEDIWDDGDKYIGHSIDHKDKELNEKTQDDKYEPPYGNKTKDCNDSNFLDEDIQNGSSSLTDEEFSDENKTSEPFENETEGTSKANNLQRQQLNRAPKGVRCYKKKYLKGISDRKLANLEGKYKNLQKEVDSITKFKLQMIQFYRNQQQQCEDNTHLDEYLKNHNIFHTSLIKRQNNKNEVAEEILMTGRFNEVTELRRPEKIPIKSSKLMQHTISESEYGFIQILRVKKYHDIERSIIMFFNIKTCPQNDRFLYSVVSNCQQHEHLPYNHQQAVLHQTSCDQEIIAIAAQVGAVISTDHVSVDLNQLVRSFWYNIKESERTRDRMIYESAVFIDKRRSYGVILIFRLRKYSSGKTEYGLTWSVIQTSQNASSTNAASFCLFENIGALISSCSSIWWILVGTHAFVESGSGVFVLNVMPQCLQLQETTNQANGLTRNAIQTTQYDSSTNLVCSSLFEDIVVLISTCSGFWGIQHGTNAFVESGTGLPVFEVTTLYLYLQEPTNQANDLTWNVIKRILNSNSVRLSLFEDIEASISNWGGNWWIQHDKNTSVESGTVSPFIEAMTKHSELQEPTKPADDLTRNVIQTTQNASSTNSVSFSLFKDIGASINTCRGIGRIQNSTKASVESGTVLPCLEVMILHLQILEPTNQVHDLRWNVIKTTLNSNSVRLSLFEDIDASISTYGANWGIQNDTNGSVESGTVLLPFIEAMTQYSQLQEPTKPADDLTWNVIQTTQNASRTKSISFSLFKDIGASINTFRGIGRIQNGTKASVEPGNVLPCFDVMILHLQLQEPPNQAYTSSNSKYAGQIAIPSTLQLKALKSHKKVVQLEQNPTKPVPLAEYSKKRMFSSLIPGTLMHMRRHIELGVINEAIMSVGIQPVKINNRGQFQTWIPCSTNESRKFWKFKRFNRHTIGTQQHWKKHKRNKAGKLKASRISRHHIADCSMTRTTETFSSISNNKPNTLKTMRSPRYKTRKKQNSRSQNVNMRIQCKGQSKNHLKLSRAYISHIKEPHLGNQRPDTSKTCCHMLRKGSPYMSRHKNQSSKHHKDVTDKGNVFHVNRGIHTNISNQNQMFGYATGDVYHPCIFEEDTCLYEDGAIGQTIQDSLSGKGIFPTGIEVRTEIHTIHDRLMRGQLNQLRLQTQSNRMHNVQPSIEQDERSEICTTLTTYDKSRIPNCRPFQANFEIPLAGGTSALIFLKNTCCVDGFLLMIYVLLEENLALRTQFEHSENDLHKIYHQIWKEFKLGNFGDGKVAWGKYGGYIADLGADGARTEKIIDILGTENERIFCVLGKHRFPLRIHCSLVDDDVYYTTQLYNVLPVYEVQGKPLCDTIKRAISKYLKRDDLPCRIHGNIKEECRGNSVQILVEPPLILPINLFFLNHGKKKHSSAEIPEIVESNEHRYELYLVRFFMDGINHFVDKIKIHGTWTFYDDCREKLYHFDVEPESVQLSSCYFVKV